MKKGYLGKTMRLLVSLIVAGSMLAACGKQPAVTESTEAAGEKTETVQTDGSTASETEVED